MKRLIKKSAVNPAELDMEKIYRIGEEQFERAQVDANDEHFISFDFKGVSVVNPFMDETGRFNVDPIEYYGNAFLNSEFSKFTKDSDINWDDVEEIPLDNIEAPDNGDYNDKKITKDHRDEKYW